MGEFILICLLFIGALAIGVACGGDDHRKERRVMDDLIKRQDAIDACLNGFCACVSDCVDEIEKLPSAQKTGKWGCTTHYGDRYIVCSVCHAERRDDLSSGWNYCPCCGAYMRGEDDG